jgi:hypothetical protein
MGVVARDRRSLQDSKRRRQWAVSQPFSSWWVLALAAVLLTATVPTSAQVNVTTWGYNNQRTNVNSNETILTPANVNSTSFGKLFSYPVDGYIYARPLYVSNVTIGGAVHNVVYVATEHDSVYAFDADSSAGANAQPLWHTSFLSPGVTTVSVADVNCGDINPEYGVTGTPVIDLSTNTMYVVAETNENNGTSFVKRLHALDITTGAEKPGSPTVISASVTVPGQSPLVFNTRYQLNRPGLLLHDGVVYIGFGSHCDYEDWRGWILGYSYNGSSFSQTFVFSTEPSSVNGRGAGIWMSGEGLPMDSGSNLFFGTGNGQFDTDVTPPINYGDSLLRIDLSKGPSVQDYFTPWTQSTMDLNDGDLGSGGMAILPDQPGPNPHLLVQMGKDGVLRVINRDNMGQYSSTSDNIVQEVGGNRALFGSPVYFNGKIYFGALSSPIQAFTVTDGLLSTSPTDVGTDYFFFPGTTPSISANGTSNAILWAVNSHAFSNNGPGGPAVLYAYDAANLSAGALYNSNENLSRDDPGGAIKFAVPTVANGKVYLGAEGQLSVYGELGGGGATAPAIVSANSTTFTVGAAGSFTVTATGSPTPSLTETGTLPTGVTFTDNGNGTATLSGTPASGTAGTYPLTFTATNSAGTANQDFTLTVSTTQPPAITSASSTTFTVGAAGSFTVTATGSPTPSLTETGTLPTGVTFTDNGNGTATLSGTPASGTAGTYPLTFTATNSAGTANQDFTLTVSTTQPPAITSASSTTFTVGAAGSFTVTATGSPTPSLTETGTLPTGVTFTDNGNGTATLSGTPASGTAGTYPLTFTATNSAGTANQTFTLSVNSSTSLVNFGSGFLSTSGLQLNGSASWNQSASRLSLTDGGSNQAGSFFFTTPVNVQSFTNNFSFQLTNPGADGFTFTIQNVGPTALGASGGALGYGQYSSVPGIGFSIAVKFDLYSNEGEGTDSTGEYADGVTPTMPAVDLTPSGVDLHSGDIMNVQMSYDGTTLTMTITDATTAQSFSTSWTVDIPGTVGSNTAYVGFTGGTGGLTATQEIITWSYTAGTSSGTAPAITSASSTTFTVGVAGSFTVTATGSPTPSLTETGTLPTGVTFTDNGNGTPKRTLLLAPNRRPYVTDFPLLADGGGGMTGILIRPRFQDTVSGIVRPRATRGSLILKLVTSFDAGSGVKRTQPPCGKEFAGSE